MTRANQATGSIEVDLPFICRLVATVSASVVTLGILRELIIGQIGTETIVQDLRHFALDSELSLPAWYSSLLMVGCSLLLFSISRLTKRSAGPDVFHWTLLAVIFAAMAVDESVSFHEVLIDPLRQSLGTSGMLYFAWVIPGSIVVASIGLSYLPFLWRLPTRSALFIMAGGAIYVSGALGMELAGGALADQHGMQAAPYLVVAVIEESLEMIGLTVFFWALVDHLGRHFPVWSAQVVAVPKSRRAAYPRLDGLALPAGETSETAAWRSGRPATAPTASPATAPFR